MHDGRAILIAGPTASGKSALALALAERHGGTIINADSMQVYAEMRILTARPTPDEEARVPHRLYGHVPASEAYSVGRFVDDAAGEIAAAHAAGRMPIVVGGTGLYLKALLDGLAPVPATPAEIRRRWREAARAALPGALHHRLADLDPVMAQRLQPGDLQRIVRALEVLEATGRSLADWQQISGQAFLTLERTLRLLVLPDRATLHVRCDARFDGMIAAGALEEARAVAALRLDPELPAMRAIGLRPLLDHVAGRIDLPAAIARGKAETRQYVKRQTTWIKRHFVTWINVNLEDIGELEKSVLAFIQS